jgi:hypothetical protein
MTIVGKARRMARKTGIMLRSQPLLRDPAAFGIPRVIYKTKVKGKRVIWKSPAEQREIVARKILPKIVPSENETFYFRLSKRYPYIKGKKRWEEYYDLPSMEDVFHGRMNRRVKKLLKEKNLPFGELLEMCQAADAELHRILSEHKGELNLDLGPDQLMVGVRNGKADLVLVDV